MLCVNADLGCLKHRTEPQSYLGWCPIPGDFQGKAGSGPGQPDVVVVSLFIAEQLDQMVLRIPSNSNDSMISQPFQHCALLPFP